MSDTSHSTADSVEFTYPRSLTATALAEEDPLAGASPHDSDDDVQHEDLIIEWSGPVDISDANSSDVEVTIADKYSVVDITHLLISINIDNIPGTDHIFHDTTLCGFV